MHGLKKKLYFLILWYCIYRASAANFHMITGCDNIMLYRGTTELCMHYQTMPLDVIFEDIWLHTDVSCDDNIQLVK